ncbi:hypothetical protein [Moraxella oblonga]|uniref:hypothetical protein n=1 Tax=Moraxella oblonga TaxID=200413 RepID=UPI00083323A3|nr:hypothetical protein [Moraxella oblonga]
MVYLFFYDENVDIVEKGEFSLDKLDTLLSERLANSKLPFESAEKTISLTHFSLYRNEKDGGQVKDCIEVDALHNGLFKIESEKLYPFLQNHKSKSGLFGKLTNLFSSSNHYNGCEVDLLTAKTILTDYVLLDRQSFENKNEQILWKKVK